MLEMSSHVSDVCWSLVRMDGPDLLEEDDMDPGLLAGVQAAMLYFGDRYDRFTLASWKGMLGLGIGSNKRHRVRAAKLAATIAFVFARDWPLEEMLRSPFLKIWMPPGFAALFRQAAGLHVTNLPVERATAAREGMAAETGEASAEAGKATMRGV